MQETFLVIHILAGAAWIGGSLMFGFAGPRMARAGGPAAGAWLGVASDAALKFYMPAAIVLLLSGVALVETGDAWSWSQTFVWLGILVVVAAILVGFVVNRPALAAAKDAAAAGDGPGAAAHARKAAMGGTIILLLLIVAEVLMVTRFGA